MTCYKFSEAPDAQNKEGVVCVNQLMWLVCSFFHHTPLKDQTILSDLVWEESACPGTLVTVFVASSLAGKL